MGDIQFRRERSRRKHSDQGHAIHVVGDGFTSESWVSTSGRRSKPAGGLPRDAESAPAFTLGELEAFKHMEEWNRGVGICHGGAAWKGCENSLDRPLWCCGVRTWTCN
jgi:hypothetical protein